MSSFLGTYADLRGRIGRFTVEALAGRDRDGAPCWKVVCDLCCYPQTLTHSKIAPLVQGHRSQITLLCANPACPQSHRENQSETLADIRRQERQQREQEAEAKRTADARAAQEQAQAARAYEVQRQYTRYVNHQFGAGQSDEYICTRKRWFELTPRSRQIVLDVIAKDPNVRLKGF